MISDNFDGLDDSRRPRYASALLMDDDPFSLNVAQLILESLGVENIATASDGLAGVTAFDRMNAKPDLIICDPFMPVMDGIEVVNELGDRNFAGGVILVTAGDLTIMQVAAMVAKSGNRLMLLGALSKPLTSAAIGNALGNILEN